MDIYDFVEMLKAKAIDHREYFHYTTFDKYLKMQEPVKLPNCGGTHRLFWLTPATKTNDGMERNYGGHAYLGCFTYSPYESVGMWFMYGKQRSDAIRIGFDQLHLAKWLNANIITEGNLRKIKAFGVSYDDGGRPVYEEISLNLIDDVCLYDVAYVLSKADVEHHRWPKSVEWRREYHKVTSTDLDIVSAKEALLYSDDFTGKNCVKLPFCFKKKGWSHEREVRIVVSLKANAKQWEHIAIPFDEPLECVASNTEDNIILSPWYSAKEAPRGLGECFAKKSVFTDELTVTPKDAKYGEQKFNIAGKYYEDGKAPVDISLDFGVSDIQDEDVKREIVEAAFYALLHKRNIESCGNSQQHKELSANKISVKYDICQRDNTNSTTTNSSFKGVVRKK